MLTYMLLMDRQRNPFLLWDRVVCPGADMFLTLCDVSPICIAGATLSLLRDLASSKRGQKENLFISRPTRMENHIWPHGTARATMRHAVALLQLTIWSCALQTLSDCAQVACYCWKPESEDLCRSLSLS